MKDCTGENHLMTGPSLNLLTCARPLRLSRAGNAQYPIGMHMTGPLRIAVKKLPGHERLLLLTVRRLHGPLTTSITTLPSTLRVHTATAMSLQPLQPLQPRL